jgi:hypothetical protein
MEVLASVKHVECGSELQSSSSDTGIRCHVLCGGVPVDKTTFTNYQRLLVIWQVRKAYTMEEWSDGLVRSGAVPLVAESQFDNEDQWCLSRGLTRMLLAGDHRSEIERHLPMAARAQTELIGKPATEGMTSRYSSSLFKVYSDLRNDVSWFFPYIESIYEQLKTKLGQEPSHYLPIKCIIKQGPPGGIGGWTVSGEMGVEAGNFEKNRWCLVISAQELVNLFTGSISAGWPSDWWANQKSPFPIMVAVEVVRDLGYAHEANEYDREFGSDPLYVWHRSLRRTYGWDLYRKMFSAMKTDGVQLDRLGPNPSKKLTNYVLAYMSLGAGELYLQSATQTIPNADQRMVQDIVGTRQRILASPRTDQRWAQYLSGDLS